MNNFKTEIDELECKRRNAEYQFKRTKIDMKKECWNKKYDLDSARLDQTIKLKEMVKEIIDKYKWTLKDIDNKDVENAIHYSGNEIFMDMHNEDMIEIKKELFGDEK